ncbi:MAG: hypothetical protein WD851_23710 [Pirellulales bacterium]
MTQLILDDEQVAAVRQAADRVEVRDQNGNLVAYFTKQPTATSEEIAIARSRMNWPGPWHTTEQFLARLHALPERLPTSPGQFSREETYCDK